jgi:poly(A) polymerase
LINNKKISKFAISIIEDLQKNKFQGYLVGGCVRDLLCGLDPKDFDIATDATPEQVRKIFKASRIIGRRFKLVHVFNRSELIEVATFRSGEINSNDGELVKDRSGKIIRDNIWGNLDQDTYRRDFTVNALYYCPQTNKQQGKTKEKRTENQDPY